MIAGGPALERGKRILGVDYGRKRVGIAVSDPLRTIARGLTVLQNGKTLIARICDLAATEGAGAIVVGLPLTLRGEKGEMAMEVERFIVKLRDACGLPVVAFDERHTSTEALSSMIGMGVPRKKRGAKGAVDRVASALILQSYLDGLVPDGDRPDG